MMLWLACLPSLVSSYLLLCLINEQKRSLFRDGVASVQSWAYLGFFGGSLFTWVAALMYGVAPNLGKLMMDAAVMLYFGQRSWRVSRRKRKKG